VISKISLNIVFFKQASNKSTLPLKLPVTKVEPSGFQQRAVTLYNPSTNLGQFSQTCFLPLYRKTQN